LLLLLLLILVLEDIKTVIRSFSKEVWAEEYIAKLISAGLPVPTAATVVAHGLSAAPFLAHILQPPQPGTLAANQGPSLAQMAAQQAAQALMSPVPSPSPTTKANRTGVTFADGLKNNTVATLSSTAIPTSLPSSMGVGVIDPNTITTSSSSSEAIPTGVNPLFPIFTKWVESDNLAPKQIILATPLSSSWIRCFLRVLFHPVFKYEGLTSFCLWNTYCGDKGVAHIVCTTHPTIDRSFAISFDDGMS
jgi:hypothetical protein